MCIIDDLRNPITLSYNKVGIPSIWWPIRCPVDKSSCVWKKSENLLSSSSLTSWNLTV